jgi:trans-aconitate methyltransferase
MDQTPAHDRPNPDLLAAMPPAQRVVEVGCSRGALARAFKTRHPDCHYLGIEIEPSFAAVARAHCDLVLVGDIEDLFNRGSLRSLPPAQCWVFGDTLEHLRDPWSVLRTLHPLLTADGCVCACIPNMQHWSIQLRLNGGRLAYADSGLLDRTHLRWFTRKTMLDLFTSSGFQVEALTPRIFAHPQNEAASQQIGQFARQIGHDPEEAVRDALPLQYVIRARPTPISPATAAPR